MIKTSITLQDLRRKIYIKSKAEPQHRFWGLYVHVCKKSTLEEAFRLVKINKGSAGVDNKTIEQIEESGVDQFIQDIQASLISKNYVPSVNRIVSIPKGNGKFRTLGIATIRDRVVQASLKLILEPIFEADFQDGSYGYRPGKTAGQAIKRVAQSIVDQKTKVIDLDIKTYFDSIRHHILLEKVAKRINDPDVMHLLRLMLKTAGKIGVPQGSVISPLLSNIYLNDIDKMLEKARELTLNQGKYYQIEYVRWADDLVVLMSSHRNNIKLRSQVQRRLREELSKIDVKVNEEKSRYLSVTSKETFCFLGFEFRKIRTRNGKRGVLYVPKKEAKLKLRQKLRKVFKSHVSQPLTKVRDIINPILRGWVNYFRIGNSSRAFAEIKRWLELKVRRHLMVCQKRKGFGWKRWSTKGLFAVYNIFSDFKVAPWKASPTR